MNRKEKKTMKLKDLIEAVEGNERAFPEGMDTDLDSVTRYLAVISVDAEIEKLRKAMATAVAVAENLDSKTKAELNAAFDAVSDANEELRKASLRAAAELNK